MRNIQIFMDCPIVGFEDERRDLLNFLNVLFALYERRNVRFSLNTPDTMSKSMRHASFLSAIVQKILNADLYFLILERSVDSYTQKEFEIAWKHFNDVGHPIIIPYFLSPKGVMPDNSVLNFQNRLKELEYYPQVLSSMDELKVTMGVEIARSIRDEVILDNQVWKAVETVYTGEEQFQIRECKVIFLGDGAAGKSCLIDRIVNNHFDKDSNTTHGVRITKWETEIANAPFTLRVMDFGGQEILHSMHRCFLTGHTVYVVVCESRDDTEIDAVAARWLDTVHAFAPGCPVILALNKADQNGNVSVNEKDLKKRNPALKLVLRTSAKVERDAKYGVNGLIQAIQDEVPGCINQYRANADALAVKQSLEDMMADYITSEDYCALCEKNRLTDPDTQHGLLKLFKELGVAYFYENDELDTRLESVRVLNPQWLTNGIYRLIVWTPDNGVLSHRTIRKTLENPQDGDVGEERYTAEETEYILHVMRQFEISHRMKRNGETLELIPMKMPKDPPDMADRFPRDGEQTLHLRWKGVYLPNNLIHRLMIRKFDELDTDGQTIWRTGALFWTGDNSCMALAELSTGAANALDVYVTGKGPVRDYMETFRTMIGKLLTELNLKAEETICRRYEGQEGQIPYGVVMDACEMGLPYVLFHDTMERMAPEDLLRLTYAKPSEEREKYRQSREWEGRFSRYREAGEEKPSPMDTGEKAKNESEAEKNHAEAWYKRVDTWYKIALIVAVALGCLYFLILAVHFLMNGEWDKLPGLFPGLPG